MQTSTYNSDSSTYNRKVRVSKSLPTTYLRMYVSKKNQETHSNRDSVYLPLRFAAALVLGTASSGERGGGEV